MLTQNLNVVANRPCIAPIPKRRRASSARCLSPRKTIFGQYINIDDISRKKMGTSRTERDVSVTALRGSVNTHGYRSFSSNQPLSIKHERDHAPGAHVNDGER